MDNRIKADLRSLEKGISLIETAHKNGIQLIPDEGKLKLRKDPDAVDYDKQQATISAEILKQNYESILAITAHPDETRELLARSQIRMIEAHEWLLTPRDLWDRLEKAYRAVFRTSECIMGAEGCQEAAVVCCRTCEKGVSDAG